MQNYNQKEKFEHIPKDKQHDEQLRIINKGVYEARKLMKNELENFETQPSDQIKDDIKIMQGGDENELYDKEYWIGRKKYTKVNNIKDNDKKSEEFTYDKDLKRTTKQINNDSKDILEEGTELISDLASGAFNKTRELISKF